MKMKKVFLTVPLSTFLAFSSARCDFLFEEVDNNEGDGAELPADMVGEKEIQGAESGGRRAEGFPTATKRSRTTRCRTLRSRRFLPCPS